MQNFGYPNPRLCNAFCWLTKLDRSWEKVTFSHGENVKRQADQTVGFCKGGHVPTCTRWVPYDALKYNFGAWQKAFLELSSLARLGRDESFNRLGYRVFLHKTVKRAPLVYGLIGFPQA